ncbi:MAG: HD domain-containing phosphohydrolase [Anaerolineaceae bacterium]|nr:HD domain-containing phosphohydrolase [Anaerolineaceae bacterium]
MELPLRVLIIEDSESDAALAIRLMRKAGYEVNYERVETAEELRTALQRQPWDLIISDYHLPRFDGEVALMVLKETGLDIPFIIVSGEVGEETAVRMMKLGAHDYLMKDKLTRLAPAVERELREARVRGERKEAEKQIHRQLARLNALHSIDLSINSSFDLHSTLSIILEQTIIQLGVDAAVILRFNPQTGTLDYAAGCGFRSPALQNTHLHLGEGYAGRAAQERNIVNIPNIVEAGGIFAQSLLSVDEVFTSYYGAPLIVKGEMKGVLEVLKRFTFHPDAEWMSFLDTLAGQAAIAIDNVELFEDLQRSNKDLAATYDTTLEGWSHALDLRDKETEGHTQRVVEMTLRLARQLGTGEAELVHIRRGALLHDVGKLGIPDSILLKTGPLTEEEWVVMRLHPVYAYEWLKPISYLSRALDIPYCHHEKWDGSGYPRGLKGEQIPLAARIFAVTDVWDALVNDRPYRAAWPEEKVLAYIQEQSGKHFDPQIVKIFLTLKKG